MPQVKLRTRPLIQENNEWQERFVHIYREWNDPHKNFQLIRNTKPKEKS